MVRDHSFHSLQVAAVVAETADASSFVLDVPVSLKEAYAYDAGQFCTFRVVVDGQPHLRCYSMSSAPGIDDELAVTVKRVPGGLVSNWLLDSVAPGHSLEATVPAGVFRLGPGDGAVVACSAGSGITPVFSLVKSALATTERQVRLLYANRDRDAVIFAAELEDLAARHPDRLEVVHHLDIDRGFVEACDVRSFLGEVGAIDLYVCGPPPFMDIVERVALEAGVEPDRFHIERFSPPAPVDVGDAPSAGPTVTEVTIELNGKRGTTKHHPGSTILQTARQLGMTPPSSCESGSCATCMARVLEGSVSMFVNDALTDDEVAEGWVLTCQAVPTSGSVVVSYEGA